MFGAIQPRAIRLNRIEQQSSLGAILHRVRYQCNGVARLVGHSIPALADHDVDARSLDIPCSHSGGVGRVRANRDDESAVWVLQPILLHDAAICKILGYIEHRAGMMAQSRTGRQEQNSRHRHQTQNCLFRLHLFVTVTYSADEYHRSSHRRGLEPPIEAWNRTPGRYCTSEAGGDRRSACLGGEPRRRSQTHGNYD
jgi:hypothetical protein